MEKTANHGNRKKKGLTLVETLISLSVIVIVSLATVSIVVYSTNAISSARRKSFFAHETNTLANLYLTYNDTPEDFTKAVRQYSGQDVVFGTDYTFFYSEEFSYVEEAKQSYSLLLDFDVSSLLMSARNAKGEEFLSMEVTL